MSWIAVSYPVSMASCPLAARVCKTRETAKRRAGRSVCAVALAVAGGDLGERRKGIGNTLGNAARRAVTGGKGLVHFVFPLFRLVTGFELQKAV